MGRVEELRWGVVILALQGRDLSRPQDIGHDESRPQAAPKALRNGTKDVIYHIQTVTQSR